MVANRLLSISNMIRLFNTQEQCYIIVADFFLDLFISVVITQYSMAFRDTINEVNL